MKLKNILIMGLAGLMVSGCKKSLLDINTNPNQLPTSTPDYVFTAAANRTVAGSLDPHELGSYWSGQWTYSNTYIISTTIFSYQFNNTNFNYWDTWYDIMNDYQYVINNAEEKGQPFMKGPAEIMKAYVMQQVVDCYGDAAYSEALKGTSQLAPKLDDQKTIYEELIKLLDQGITDVKANAFNAAGNSADIVWKGNVTNWVRFANSLKLRILIRQSRIAGRDAYIMTEINKAAAMTEGFLGTGQDAGVNPGYVASAGKMNPFYERWGYNSAGGAQALARLPRPTKYLFDVMKAVDDTFRLKRLAYAKGGENGSNPGVSTQPEIISNYVGVPYGISSGYSAPSTSYVGPAVIIKNQYNRPMILMTAAESFLLLAEAKERYGAGVTLTGTAQSYYEQGVRESFRLTGTAASAATTLLTSGKDLADWTASPDKLKAIWMQKWIALVNFNGLEAWSEFRRTNFPNIPASASAPSGQPLPVRLFYPQTESGSNPNVPAQAPTTVFNTRLFWDVD
ncbi:MAG TPA: SusD/RagB family nutrient-binding outer membrane lipoprotein [Chitinophagaceae bacterium]